MIAASRCFQVTSCSSWTKTRGREVTVVTTPSDQGLRRRELCGMIETIVELIGWPEASKISLGDVDNIFVVVTTLAEHFGENEVNRLTLEEIEELYHDLLEI